MVRLPPARLVDWSVLVGTVLVLATGGLTLIAGGSGEAWVFVLHGTGGIALAVFLAFKLYRVRRRLARTDRTVALSALLALATLGAVATGVWWAFGGRLDLGPWGLLNLHVGLGLVVVPLLVYHLTRRFRPLRRADLGDRRIALTYGGILVGGALAWRTQQFANRALQTAGADRRFTGSRERGSDEGNRFPVTSWVADDPDPVDVGDWQLRVEGLVEASRTFDYDDLPTGGERRAVLDCTSGWYSEHDWAGVRVGDLLDHVGVRAGAGWVQFRSVTGYRWSLPLEEAREALLAARVDGDRLSHGHGFPLRLVAPGRRGFQWVKWVESVRVTRRRDRSEWLAVFVSGIEA